MISKLFQFILWFFVWLLLSWPPSAKDIITGLLVSLFVSLMTIDIFAGLYEAEKEPARPKPTILNCAKRFSWFLFYIVIFIWECFKANFDVAYRVVCPHLPIRPGTVRVKTNLRSEIALTFLANSLTLTPGNTTVDIDKDNGFIYVHRLCLPEGYEKSGSRLAVVERFDEILKRVFE